MGDPEVRAQCCSKVYVNAFISEILKAGLWLCPFTILYESYKPINLPCTPCLGKHRLGWVGMVMKVSWPRTLLNWRESLALLSSSRSTPQPLKRSFIPAFIAASGLSSLTFHCTRLNIFLPLPKRTHGLELFQNLRFQRCRGGCCLLEAKIERGGKKLKHNLEIFWLNWRELLTSKVKSS